MRVPGLWRMFSDIRNLERQTLYSNMTLIAPPRKNTSDHASHTRHRPPTEVGGIVPRWRSRIRDEDERGQRWGG